MLGRIRKALGHPAGGPTGGPSPRKTLPELGVVLPPIPPDGLVSTFEQEIEKVSGKTYRASTPAELDDTLRKILTAVNAKSVVLSRNPLLTQIGLTGKLQAGGMEVSAWTTGQAPSEGGGEQSFRERAFTAEVGISGVDFVLAESGTLVLSSQTEGAQLASLAPPVHVALYRRGQVLGSMEEVLERLCLASEEGPSLPGRSVVFITGSSRTADIEQILVHGVHGPREVHAILLEDSCLG